MHRPTSLRPVAAALVATGALAAAAAPASATPAAPTAAAAAQTPPPITIHTSAGMVTRIGALNVARDPTLRNAIRRWGRPSSRQSRYRGTACTVRWKRLQITASFGFLGAGASACSPRAGRLASATFRSPRFATTRGIRVGSASSDIQAAYPDATYENGAWTIASFYSEIGTGADQPTLRALTRGGEVHALSIYVGGAGD